MALEVDILGMMLVQFLAAGLIILIIVKTLADFKKNKINRRGFLFWLTLWLVMLVMVIQPQVTGFLAGFLGVGRGIDVAVYFSILLIFFILFKIIADLEKIRHEITEIVRHFALKDADKK